MSTPAKKDNWLRRLTKRIQQEFRWLAPGMGYKRWLILTIIGSMLLGLGAAHPGSAFLALLGPTDPLFALWGLGTGYDPDWHLGSQPVVIAAI